MKILLLLLAVISINSHAEIYYHCYEFETDTSYTDWTTTTIDCGVIWWCINDWIYSNLSDLDSNWFSTILKMLQNTTFTFMKILFGKIQQ